MHYPSLILAIVGVCIADESESTVAVQDPIISKNLLETPEVVLQIKYDGGELNKIYLAQYRKGPQEWIPSVASRTTLCSDLCYGGLGGSTCGSSCQDLVPVGLKSALSESGHNSSESEGTIGEPRTLVCPTLCENGLGVPLCPCEAMDVHVVDHVDWSAVCAIFCEADRYVLGGCPSCDAVQSHSVTTSRMQRILTTTDGWIAWCNVQCRQGQGGAACNCNRSPFQ